MQDSDIAAPTANPWDTVVERLQELRESAGSPSYEVIAKRIAATREEAGLTPAAARVAKSTVFDSLRPGRSRVNVEFLYEIAEALGGSRDAVDTWVRESRTPAVHEAPADTSPPSRRQLLAFLAACLSVNMIGRELVDALHLPIYLDMVGTAIAAIGLGPWWGAGVGVTTNSIGSIGSGMVSFAFAIVNVAGALVWGYGARRFHMMRTLPRFLLLNLLTALACSLIAVPIIVFGFGGSVHQGQDTITQTFIDLGNGILTAVGYSNLMTSAADKFISGFVALVVLSALPAAFRRGVEWVRIPS